MTNFRQGTELQSVHVCDFDPTTGSGVPLGTPNMLLIRTDSFDLYYFAGPLDTDWVRIGAGVGGNRQTFRYVATGVEANPVTIGAVQGFTARATANYNVTLTMGGPLANAFKDCRPLVSTYLVNSFQVESAVTLDAGDVLQFTVEDLT